MTRPVLTPLVDRITGSALILNHEEHDIHEGRSFTVHFENTVTNIGEMTVIGFRTPITAKKVRIHLVVDAQADDESTFEILERPSIDLGEATSELTPFNRNRGSAATSIIVDLAAGSGSVGLVSAYEETEAATANITRSAATIMHSETIGQAGNPNSITAGRTRSQREFILDNDAAGVQYAVLLAALTINDTIQKLTMNWSEDIPSDFVN